MLLIYRKCIYVYCHLKKTYIYVCMYISIHIHVQRDIFSYRTVLHHLGEQAYIKLELGRGGGEIKCYKEISLCLVLCLHEIYYSI